MEKFKQLYEQFENSEWLVSERDIEIGKKLGDGASGITYVGEYKNEKVAIKMYSVGILLNDLNSVKNEIDILTKLQHKNIVQFRGLMFNGFDDIESKRPFASTITKYAERGELGDALYKSRIIKRKGNELRFKIVIGLAQGLKYLHSFNVIHRDIKPANILLDENFEPLLTDFGFSRFFDKDSQDNMTGETGSYRYMAPEVTSHIHYSEKADVYSFALICNEIFSDEKPFEYQIAAVVALAVVQKNLRPSQKKIKNQTLKSIISKCWSADPNERPEWDEIIEQLNVAKQEMINSRRSILPPSSSSEQTNNNNSSANSLNSASKPVPSPTSKADKKERRLNKDKDKESSSTFSSSNLTSSSPASSLSSLFKKRGEKRKNKDKNNSPTSTAATAASTSTVQTSTSTTKSSSSAL